MMASPTRHAQMAHQMFKTAGWRASARVTFPNGNPINAYYMVEP
jgi:hypothetical protein